MIYSPWKLPVVVSGPDLSSGQDGVGGVRKLCSNCLYIYCIILPAYIIISAWKLMKSSVNYTRCWCDEVSVVCTWSKH